MAKVRPMHFRKTLAAVIILAGGAVASCNTMQGLGEDMRQGGIALSNAATRAQDNMSEPPPVDEARPRISMDRARSLALAARTGEITDGQLVRGPEGAMHYAFTVRGQDGAYAVGIDAQTGAVLENRYISGS